MILTATLLALLTLGCAGGESAAPALFATPSPTPTATPVPTPQSAVGILAGETRTLFFEGITADQAGDNARLVRLDNGLADLSGADFQGEHVLIAYLDGSESQRQALGALASSGTKVCAYAPRGEAAPEGVPTLSYDALGAAEKALFEAVAYEPHDTPVRLTGLFSSETSAAFLAYSAGIAEGKVFRRGVYVEGVTETAMADWILSRMADTLPGTVDGVYAETAEQALAAADAIEKAGLLGVEVFAAEATDALLNRMLAVPEILAVAVGTNDAYAGRYLRAEATRLLLDLPGASDGATLLPRLYSGKTLADDWAKLSEE